MHYIESGIGPPLVLLHAFPVDARMWNGARALLEGQARVITPDQRGLGQSPLEGAPDGEQPPDLDSAAVDVLALMDTLDLPQVILGGCSMGGYIAMSVLRRAPERVAGLLLVDTKADADTHEQHDNRLAAADRAEREGTEGWLPESTLPNVLGQTTHDERPEVVSEVRDLIQTQPSAGVAWAQRAMANRSGSAETLRAYTGPALVIAGSEDVLTPPEAARNLAAVLPANELQILPRAGHLSAVEDPRAFALAVRPWLDRLG